MDHCLPQPMWKAVVSPAGGLIWLKSRRILEVPRRLRVLIAVVDPPEIISDRLNSMRGRGALAKFSSWSPPKNRVSNKKVMQVDYAQESFERRQGFVKVQISSSQARRP